MGDSTVEAREPCPKCRANGRDRSGDNLAIYHDGHKYCFACKYYVPSDSWHLLQQSLQAASGEDKIVNGLPADFTPLKDAIWSKPAQLWLKKYGISDDEIAKYGYGWSHSRNLLILPIYDDNKKVIFWQGRNFNLSEEPKYLTFGEKRGIMHLMGNSHSGSCIVTEDAVSAIKVGRYFQSFPLWGCTMDLELIKKAASQFETLGIWLDRNKTIEAVKIALVASQYIPTFVVDTVLDPKEYAAESMLQFIGAAAAETMYKDQQKPEKEFLNRAKDGVTEDLFPGPKLPMVAATEKITYTDPNSDMRDLMISRPPITDANPHESTRVSVREDEALYGRQKWMSDWEEVNGQHSYRKHSHGS